MTTRIGKRGSYNRDPRIAAVGGYTVRTVMQGTHYVPSAEYNARQAAIQQDMQDFFKQQYEARDKALKDQEEAREQREAEQAAIDAAKAKADHKRAQVLKRVHRHRRKARERLIQQRERQYVRNALAKKLELYGGEIPRGLALDFQKLEVDPELIAEVAQELGIDVVSQDNANKKESKHEK